jgi:transposase-like protein
MNTNVRLIRKKRRFTDDFKKRLVAEYEKGRLSVLQLEKLYGISNSLIYRWIYQYSHLNEKGYRIIEMKQSSTSKLEHQERRIQELERLVGQKQITIEYLEKLIELAKQDLQIDIKKNYDTSQSSGSVKTERK